MSKYDTSTSDSTTLRSRYGIQASSNAASAATASVVAESSYVRLRADRVASDSTIGYSAYVRLDLALAPNGAKRDISEFEEISFLMRNDATITDGMYVQIVSTAYDDSLVRNGTVYEGFIKSSLILRASPSWKVVTISFLDFLTPSWWVDIPENFPTFETVLRNATGVRFEPRSLYSASGTNYGTACQKCTSPTMTSVTLDLKDITLSNSQIEPPVDTLPHVDPPDTTPYTPSRRLDCDNTPYSSTTGEETTFGNLTGGWNAPLSSYATPASDSSTARSLYGVCIRVNPASQATVTVRPDSSLRLEASLASDSTAGYSAEAALIHTIAPDGGYHDLTGLRRITFQYRTSQAITDRLAVQFVSSAYSDRLMDSGLVYEVSLTGRGSLAASTQWKTFTTFIEDFATPTWWADIPDDYPTIDDVLKSVKAIRIIPSTTYLTSGQLNGFSCTKCVGPTMPPFQLDVRNIRLSNTDVDLPPVDPDTTKPPPPVITSCSGAYLPIDTTFDDGNNAFGLPWSRVSDYDSLRSRTNPRSGSTTSSHALLGRVDSASWMVLSAVLDRNIAEVSHPLAGWAGLQTNLPIQRLGNAQLEGKSGKSYLVIPRSAAIGFRLEPKSPLGAAVAGLRLQAIADPDADSMAWSYRLDRHVLTNTRNYCISYASLVPPSNVDTSVWRMDPNDMRALRWSIELSGDSTRGSAGFRIADVRLYGASMSATTTITLPRDARFRAVYRDGILSLDGYEGIQRIEIRSMDGQLRASLVPSASQRIDLPRGTWLLVPRGPSAQAPRMLVSTNR